MNHKFFYQIALILFPLTVAVTSCKDNIETRRDETERNTFDRLKGSTNSTNKNETANDPLRIETTKTAAATTPRVQADTSTEKTKKRIKK
jgi:hypothetical protein